MILMLITVFKCKIQREKYRKLNEKGELLSTN